MLLGQGIIERVNQILHLGTCESNSYTLDIQYCYDFVIK